MGAWPRGEHAQLTGIAVLTQPLTIINERS
jgi:hypothetical protein